MPAAPACKHSAKLSLGDAANGEDRDLDFAADGGKAVDTLWDAKGELLREWRRRGRRRCSPRLRVQRRSRIPASGTICRRRDRDRTMYGFESFQRMRQRDSFSKVNAEGLGRQDTRRGCCSPRCRLTGDLFL